VNAGNVGPYDDDCLYLRSFNRSYVEVYAEVYANGSKETLLRGRPREHFDTYYSGLCWATRVKRLTISTDQSYQQLGRVARSFRAPTTGTVAMREASEACTFFALHNAIVHGHCMH